VAGSASDKTERPTPKRLKEAREKGQIARTPDLSAWAGMLGATVLLQVTFSRGSVAFHDILERMSVAIAHPELGVATRFAVDAAWRAVGVIAPLLVGMMLIGLIASISQVGARPTVKKLKPDFGRLNPLKGIKRMFGMAAWWEMAKALAKTAVLVAVAWPATSHAVGVLTHGTTSGLFAIAAVTATTALTVIRNVALAGLAVAAADYIVQRRRLMRDLRMTRQEVREELRQQEGSPEIKHAIRSRQMAISRNRMIRMVSLADVVIVNPTHYAVALRYEAERGAPEVLAKGAGAIAARIRLEAGKHGVPVVREPVLCRTIYKTCAVGQIIPLELYEAVAQVLAFVFGLRARGRAQGSHEFPRPVLA
jgi:flagellar biosynthetic protein FlhB